MFKCRKFEKLNSIIVFDTLEISLKCKSEFHLSFLEKNMIFTHFWDISGTKKMLNRGSIFKNSKRCIL